MSMKGDISAQAMNLANIPSRVLANWPVWLSFGAVDFALNLVLAAVPRTGGLPGQVINSAVGGMVQVTQMVAWDVLKIA